MNKKVMSGYLGMMKLNMENGKFIDAYNDLCFMLTEIENDLIKQRIEGETK